MTKGVYVGVGGVAKKVKKIYAGVNGVARKIKKAYVGVGGIARPCFSSELQLAYYGTITPLSVLRGSLASASVGDYALFGGGSAADPNDAKSTIYYSTVDSYNKSLTHGTPTGLSAARNFLSAASVGGYAIFAGGDVNHDSGSMGDVATVDAYNTSLTRSTPTGLSVARDRIAATSVGNYAIFAGGGATAGTDLENSTVDAYSSSLVRTTISGLSRARGNAGAASIGNYAIFAGGWYHTVVYYQQGGNGYKYIPYSTVDVYTSSLVRSTPTGLSSARCYIDSASTTNYAIFAGGHEDPTPTDANAAHWSNTVDVFNASLARSTVDSLSSSDPDRILSYTRSTTNHAASLGTSVVVSNTTFMDMYSDSLVKKTMNSERECAIAASVSNYAIMPSGIYDSTTEKSYSVVDVYTLV